MKKSRIALVMILVLCLGVIATGCTPGGGGGNSGNDNGKTEDSTEKVYDDSLITEAFSEEGTFSDGYGSYDYTLHVPQLVSESEDAKAINQEIMDGSGAVAQESFEWIQSEKTPWASSITWSSAWKGSVVSLLITEYYTAGPANYRLYNYDFKEEKIVTNEEIFKLLDITEEEFLTAAKKAAVDDMNSWGEEELDYDETYVKMYYDGMFPLDVTTLQEIDPKSAMIFAGEDEVQMVMQGFTPAGGGVYSTMITLDFEKKEQPEKEVEYKGITARLKDGKVLVQYDGEAVDWIDVGRCLVNDDQYTGGKEYEVTGCYRDYVDIFISQAGYAQNAYLYLLTDTGDLEMVNLIKGASVGVLSAIPIPYITNIVSVEETVDSYNEVWAYAVEEDGTEHDLSVFADATENRPHLFLTPGYSFTTDMVTHKVDGGGSYESYFELITDENGFVEIHEFVDGESEAVMNYVGTMVPLGCNEEGTLYYFDIGNRDGVEIYLGSFLIRNVMSSDEEYGGIEFGEIEIKVNTGIDIFDTQGEWLRIGSDYSVG